ncbi:MAG TPA: GlxA family transcriptional regulator [Stellaceae bacterium]|nr:GlxA family transcriptional regulator [Stellaceae bacterium]
MTLDIGFLVYPGFQILDLSGPLAAFQIAGRLTPDRPYGLPVVSAQGGMIASSCGLAVMTRPLGDSVFDTLIVVGGNCEAEVATGELAAILRRCSASARRVASVCTGAFILAAAGLLDGRIATTHWRHIAALQRRYPRVKVAGDRIFAKDGAIWTSAGISAGIDLALALIEEDRGLEISRETARELVVYHRRPGGQSQFSTMLDLDPESDRIRAALAFAREHLDERLSVERLAGVACLSPRQFGRAFLAETGETPAKAVERLRAEAARLRIETSAESIEVIARQVGFSDPERMRRAFLRVFGQPPQGIRRAARAA